MFGVSLLKDVQLEAGKEVNVLLSQCITKSHANNVRQKSIQQSMQNDSEL